MNIAAAREETAILEKAPFAQAWEQVKMRLKAAFGEATFKSWLGAMQYRKATRRGR